MGMIIINKRLLILILALALTACNSKSDEQANGTQSSSSQQQTTTQQSTIQQTETALTQEQTTLIEEESTTTQEETIEESSQKKIEESTTQQTTQKSESTTESESSTINEQTTTQENTTAETESVSNEIAESTQASKTDSGDVSTENITSNESNTKVAWSFKRNSEHNPVMGYNEGVDLEKFDACYLGDTSQKVIYLTFDEGYEYGFSNSILDTLKANDVKAAFFLTGDFIEREADLCKRMVQEGHIVGNHSVNHPSMQDLSDEEIVYEIEENAKNFKEATGYEMDKFFRPPKGEFSPRVLDIAKQLNYKTIFWSLAYVDWNVDNQPGKDAAYQHVMDNYHNGGIFLLHAVSQSNAEALDDIIKSLKAEGYTFASLKQLL